MSSARTHTYALSRYTNVHARWDSCADALLPYYIHTRSTVLSTDCFVSHVAWVMIGLFDDSGLQPVRTNTSRCSASNICHLLLESQCLRSSRAIFEQEDWESGMESKVKKPKWVKDWILPKSKKS